MLERTASLADLAQRSHASIGMGQNSLSHPFSLETLILVDASGWTQSGGQWSADFVPENVQLATLTHAEMATDRFCRQFATALNSLVTRGDPHWLAVTCYYAAFYAAQALLLLLGQGAVRVPATLHFPFRGIYEISSTPSSMSVGRLTTTLSPVGSGSHKATWLQLDNILSTLILTETDSRAIVVLETLRHEIRSPVLLSDARNEINYNLTASPFKANAWSSLLIDISGPDEVEHVLATGRQDQPERRFEIVALALGLLAQQLRQDFKARGGKLDRRQTKARAAELPQRPWLC